MKKVIIIIVIVILLLGAAYLIWKKMKDKPKDGVGDTITDADVPIPTNDTIILEYAGSIPSGTTGTGSQLTEEQELVIAVNSGYVEEPEEPKFTGTQFDNWYGNLSGENLQAVDWIISQGGYPLVNNTGEVGLDAIVGAWNQKIIDNGWVVYLS